MNDTSKISLELTKPVGRPRKFIDSLAKDYINQTLYNQIYYKKNKDKKKETYTKQKQIIVCDCGNQICFSNLNIHLKTKLHKRRLAIKQNTCLLIN